MTKFIIIILYSICFIFIIIAFITVLFKKEGSWKKAGMEFLIAILSMFLGFFLQFGFDFVVEKLSPMNEEKIDDADSESIVHNNLGKKENNKEIHTHKKYKEEKENYVDATCVDSGSYEEVEYCECGNEINRKKVTINALGHNYIGTITEPNCTEQGFTKYICSRCNDEYTDDYIEALGHDYKEGVCNRCEHLDPDYEKVYDNERIMKILSNSIVSDSGTYKSYLGAESISVFAEDRYNCFSINTAVSYNLWGGNVQNVIFNVSELSDLDVLKFDVGGETGSSGSMKVEVFLDKTFDDGADDIYELDASAIPINISVNINGVTSMGIRVTNFSNNINKLVFFNFSEGKD